MGKAEIRGEDQTPGKVVSTAAGTLAPDWTEREQSAWKLSP
jgi:hypothetical protein